MCPRDARCCSRYSINNEGPGCDRLDGVCAVEVLGAAARRSVQVLTALQRLACGIVPITSSDNIPHCSEYYPLQYYRCIDASHGMTVINVTSLLYKDDGNLVNKYDRLSVVQGASIVFTILVTVIYEMHSV